MNGNDSGHEHVGTFQLVVLILSVVVLGALFADTAFKLPTQISNILQSVDTLVCVLLLSDFGIRFYRAKSKLAFMKWGWIDLIASIPNIPILRMGRLVRILRVIRLLRAIRATHKITSIILQDKIKTGFASVILSSFLLVTFASIGILICEQTEPTANIKTAGDAVWWSVTTITTVGYGDKYPVTAEGRALAMMLMVCGAGTFALVSGLVASSIIGIKKDKGEGQNEIIDRLKRLEEKIDALNHNGSSPD
jgi:voltage-gated potassium channel